MVTTAEPSAYLYRAVVAHVRRRPFQYRLRHRTYYWLVDVDDLPRPRWPVSILARFDSGDHVGDPRATIRDNIEEFLRDHGVEPPSGAIRMLCHARSLGHVFNPLTVYWCHDHTGRVTWVIAEVHNTYRQRHRYLLRPASPGEPTEVDKSFYVSPFFPVSGSYRLRLPEPDAALRLSIAYEIDGEDRFVAAVTGDRCPATTANLLRAAWRHPLSTLAVSAAIRWHGIRLYLRGLPIQSRPDARDPRHRVGQRGDSDD